MQVNKRCQHSLTRLLLFLVTAEHSVGDDASDVRPAAIQADPPYGLRSPPRRGCHLRDLPLVGAAAFPRNVQGSARPRRDSVPYRRAFRSIVLPPHIR